MRCRQDLLQMGGTGLEPVTPSVSCTTGLTFKTSIGALISRAFHRILPLSRTIASPIIFSRLYVVIEEFSGKNSSNIILPNASGSATPPTAVHRIGLLDASLDTLDFQIRNHWHMDTMSVPVAGQWSLAASCSRNVRLARWSGRRWSQVTSFVYGWLVGTPLAFEHGAGIHCSGLLTVHLSRAVQVHLHRDHFIAADDR